MADHHLFIDLDDDQLQDLVEGAARVAMVQRETGNAELADGYHDLAVAAAEAQDRRRHAVESARIAVDGPDAGELWDGTLPSFDD